MKSHFSDERDPRHETSPVGFTQKKAAQTPAKGQGV